MSNVTAAIPAFIGGVSQQAPSMRLLSQGEVMDNCHATVADGLMQKPNSELVKVLGAIATDTTYKIHGIHRDADEKYIAILTDHATDPVKVFDLDGVAQTVAYGYYDASDVWQEDANIKNYLTDGSITDAKQDIKAVSIADYTIICNTQKTTAEGTQAIPDANSTSDPEGDVDPRDVVYLKFSGIHKGEYSVTLRWFYVTAQSGTHTINVSWNSGAYDYSTDTLMEAFKTEIESWSPSPTGSFVCTIEDKVMKILYDTPAGLGYDLQMNADTGDPFGQNDLMAINRHTVKAFKDLPSTMPETVTIKVGGDHEENQDDYYMKFDHDDKTWYETYGWDLDLRWDWLTMPHKLVRVSAGQFRFSPILWSDRTVGDDDTNPFASFYDSTINNMLFAKNRLWFMSGENLIGSKAGDYFNFWSSTVLDVLDDDPIDVAGTGQQVTKMRSGVSFEGGILCISDEEQFALTSGDQLMTPKSVAIDSTTAYTADVNSQPIKLGADVYFASPKGSYISIRDYTIMPDTLMQNAYDITSHVPRYIPYGDVTMAGCNTLDMLFVVSDDDPSIIYVHQFMWDGEKKVQTAWYRWTYDDDIIGMIVFGTVMYLIFYDATNDFTLQKINLEIVPYDADQDIRYHMDVLMKQDNGVFDDPDTTFALDFDVGDGTGWTVVDGSTNAEVTSGFTLANQVLTFTAADKSAETYFVGRDYTATFQFSEWYMRDQQGQAIVAGDLAIRNITLSFVDTGYFKLEITPFGRSAVNTEVMSGIRIDESTIGEIDLLSGEETFLIMAASRRTVIKLITDSYLPMQIQTAAWHGTFVHKGKIV